LANRVQKPVARLAAVAAIVGLCLLLAYAALTETIASVLAPSRADVALIWRPGDAGALQALAEARAGEALTDSEIRSRSGPPSPLPARR
jgi:hypothetical protein